MAIFETIVLGMFGGYTEAAAKFIEITRADMIKLQEEEVKKAAEKVGRRLTNRELMVFDMINTIMVDDMPPLISKDFKARLLKYHAYFKHKRRFAYFWRG